LEKQIKPSHKGGMEFGFNQAGHLNVKLVNNQIGDKGCSHLTKAKWNLN
jgi:hypothetical protein